MQIGKPVTWKSDPGLKCKIIGYMFVYINCIKELMKNCDSSLKQGKRYEISLRERTFPAA